MDSKLRVIFYDAEIANPVPPKNHWDREHGINYCQGWGDFEGMGIACVVIYDTLDNSQQTFLDVPAHQARFQNLVDGAKGALFVSFNGIEFDNKLIAANWQIIIPKNQCYDILDQIRIALDTPYPKGRGLDAIGKTNFGAQKSMDGAKAPIFWQMGMEGQVINYCGNDVQITRRTFNRIYTKGHIIDSATNQPLKISPPRANAMGWLFPSTGGGNG